MFCKNVLILKTFENINYDWQSICVVGEQGTTRVNEKRKLNQPDYNGDVTQLKTFRREQYFLTVDIFELDTR